MTHMTRRTALTLSLAAGALTVPSLPFVDQFLKGTAMAATPAAETLKVGEDTLSYLTAGSGPALVIVHGVGGHKEDWVGVIAAFQDKRTVYAIDMLGFGGSSRDAKDMSMPMQANAIKALLEAKGVAKADIIGNSVGGWAAATFAATYPDMTDKLIVVDPAGFKAMFEGQPPVNLFPNNVDEMKKLLSFVLASDFAHTDDFAKQAFEKFQASGEKTIEARLGPNLFGSPKLEEVMPKIKAQSLVIWGKEDKLFPVALAPYITSLIPGATTVIIENASHFPQVDQLEAFNKAATGFLLG
jgi:pimeloyl-ACP methyl ester carboxylesterase